MAFSEEQEQQILEGLGKLNEFLSSQNKDNKGEDNKTPPENDTLLNKAKENIKNEADKNEIQANLENAVSFNMSVSNFADKYKDVLPVEIKRVIDLSNGKNYDSAVAKANEMRKTIIEAFLEVQANVDALPEGMKAKANLFKSLTEDAKLEKSGLYWELVEVGAELQASKKRAEAVNRANNGNNSGEDNAFRAKFLALGDKFKRKE